MYDHALATGFSRGYLVSAGVLALAVIIALAVIHVRRQDLSSADPAGDITSPAGGEARETRSRPQPGSVAWPLGGEGASRPRARARATVSARRCVPSLAYRWRRWVLTVLCETYSSLAISGPDRLVGR